MTNKYWAELHTACGAKQTIPILYPPPKDMEFPLFFKHTWRGYNKKDKYNISMKTRTFILSGQISEFTFVYEEKEW